jgi:hypothetical protein
MTSVSLLGAAIAVFVIAALLYFQSHPDESFINPPVAGRPYGAFGNVDPVPADLNKALLTTYTSSVPTPQQRPATIPGPGVAPKEAPAQRKDLMELDNKIMVWLDGAAQRERERPGSLTPEQLQRRVILQARLVDVRNQLGTGLLTDTYREVSQESQDLRRENAGWRQAAPNLEAVHDFAKGAKPDAFLTAEQYKEFRGIFDAAVLELQGFMQPDPLQRVRVQQLQVMRQDLMSTERKFHPPPIRVATAQLYLKQMLKVDQPLPSLYSMEPSPQTQPTALSADPADVIGALQDIKWKLTVSYDPAEQELKRSVSAMLDRLYGGGVSEKEVQAARTTVIEFLNKRAPVPVHSGATAPLAYDPKNIQQRATTLCRQIRSAFPRDAEALGCPRAPVKTDYDAESVVNTVCDRLRTSVPTVTPEQFNCPAAPL